MVDGPVSPEAFLDAAPRFLFFTGKGGVGKTTLSSATALALARRGRNVLLISTDPASNLPDVLGAALTTRPVALDDPPTLWALNIDPEVAAREYREKVLAPYRTSLPAAMVTGIEEQLSGACTTEIAAFNEFARFLGDDRATAAFDHVIFDTAPTGHTLRLLQLPSAWQNFIETNPGGASCLGPLSGLVEQKRLYADALAALCDPARTQLVLVSRPERSALAEAARSQQELGAIGLRNLHLFLNGVVRNTSDDPVAAAMAQRQQDARAAMPASLRDLAITEFSLQPFNTNGRLALAAIMDSIHLPVSGTSSSVEPPILPSLHQLIDGLAANGHGVILTMGKGGVGKTTMAAAIAVALAARGYAVHLTTTDPAAHLDQTLGSGLPSLTVSRIDPKAEVAAYAADVLATAGAGLDDDDRRLLEEDLRSPCTEEIAVFRAFAAEVARGGTQFVVLDTAPTGHTLLLLDATEAYHREVLRNRSEMPESVRGLLPRLRDPSYSKVLIVTLPEYTPVREAAALQEDLRRAGIEPHAWIINQSLQPLTTRDPLLAARRHAESPHIESAMHAARTSCLVGWQATPPVGNDALARLTLTPHEEIHTP